MTDGSFIGEFALIPFGHDLRLIFGYILLRIPHYKFYHSHLLFVNIVDFNLLRVISWFGISLFAYC